MAYSISTSITSRANLMAQVSTFAQAQGWTEDNQDAGNYKLSLHKGSCYVHFFWNDTSAAGVTYGTSIAMYQSLGYIGAGTDQWAHTYDSQNGANSAANLGAERGIKFIGPGPYTSLSMFGHTDTDVIYCVLEVAPGLYRHFGFGNIVKTGTWTGGEWVAGHHWNPESSGVLLDDPDASSHSLLLDGLASGSTTYPLNVRAYATMHVEGLPDQEQENPRYGIVGYPPSFTSAPTIVGRDGKLRCKLWGGSRASYALNAHGWVRPDLTKGYIPIIPMDLYYWYLRIGDAEDVYYLGRMHNIGHIQLIGIDPGQTLAVGGESWVAFPGVRKALTLINTPESWNMGIIYKK